MLLFGISVIVPLKVLQEFLGLLTLSNFGEIAKEKLTEFYYPVVG